MLDSHELRPAVSQTAESLDLDRWRAEANPA
jgi:hypothetical protein